jgi:hypothetical protein
VIKKEDQRDVIELRPRTIFYPKSWDEKITRAHKNRGETNPGSWFREAIKEKLLKEEKFSI